MKNIKLGRWIIAFFVALAFLYPLRSVNTDIWSLGGQGVYNNKDMARVDSNYNLRLFNGNIYLGDNALTPTTNQTQVTPSTSVGGFYSIKVPFFNGSGAATAIGSVVVASATFISATSSTFEGSMVAKVATTTVLGISDGVYANGAVGYMTVSGYALVLTTGTVPVGSVLVSTDGSNAAGAAGYAGVTTGTQVVGTAVGKALTAGNPAGGTVLALISLQ